MSGGLFGWISEGFAEIGSQVAGVFSSDDASGSNSGQTQARTNSVSESSNSGEAQVRNIGGYQRANEACNGQSAWSQAFEFDPSTNDVNTKLRESGCKGKAGIYLIRDEHDERTLYVGKAEGTSRDILSRLKAHLTGEGNSGISERIERGETVTIRWVECDDQKKYESVVMAYLLPSDNERAEYLGAERTRIEEEIAIGILLDLPSFWHENYEKMVEEAHEQGLYVAGYGSNRVEVAEAIFWRCNEETKENYDDDRGSGGSSSSNDSQESGGSWDLFGNWFPDQSDSKPSDSPHPNPSNSDKKDDSWFSDLFGENSDFKPSDSPHPNPSNSQETNGSSDLFANSFDDSKTDSSDYGSGGYGTSENYGGNSGESDTTSSSSDSSDSDSTDSSDYGSGGYGTNENYGGNSDEPDTSSSDSW